MGGMIMEEKWEYMSNIYTVDYCEIDCLNLMGNVGWEAFAVTTYEVNKTTFIKIFFKRKIQKSK